MSEIVPVGIIMSFEFKGIPFNAYALKQGKPIIKKRIEAYGFAELMKELFDYTVPKKAFVSFLGVTTYAHDPVEIFFAEEELIKETIQKIQEDLKHNKALMTEFRNYLNNNVFATFMVGNYRRNKDWALFSDLDGSHYLSIKTLSREMDIPENKFYLMAKRLGFLKSNPRSNSWVVEEPGKPYLKMVLKVFGDCDIVWYIGWKESIIPILKKEYKKLLEEESLTRKVS